MYLPLTRDLNLSRSLQLNFLSKMNTTRSEPMRVAIITTIISQKPPDTDSCSLNIMKRNTCKTYVINRKCWQWWWSKWTIDEFQLVLHTLNVLLLFSSFDSTVNNICLRYRPNFTNTFQLHMYDCNKIHAHKKNYNDNIGSISANDNSSKQHQHPFFSPLIKR